MSERRDLGFKLAEFRFADGDKRTLEGYASMFNVPYDLGRFHEVVEPGAFTRALDEGQDVRAVIDHYPQLSMSKKDARIVHIGKSIPDMPGLEI